jgi:hypothetical protein
MFNGLYGASRRCPESPLGQALRLLQQAHRSTRTLTRFLMDASVHCIWQATRIVVMLKPAESSTGAHAPDYPRAFLKRTWRREHHDDLLHGRSPRFVRGSHITR